MKKIHSYFGGSVKVHAFDGVVTATYNRHGAVSTLSVCNGRYVFAVYASTIAEFEIISTRLMSAYKRAICNTPADRFETAVLF